jgi:hypothetical protein
LGAFDATLELVQSESNHFPEFTGKQSVRDSVSNLILDTIADKGRMIQMGLVLRVMSSHRF